MVVFCCKMVKMDFFDVRMTSYSKMAAFSDFENASIVFLATFAVVYGMELEKKRCIGWVKMLRMAIFCSKSVKKCRFRCHYDVIQQNDGFFRFRKYLQFVPSHIFCGIWEAIGTKSGIRWVKMLRMTIFC